MLSDLKRFIKHSSIYALGNIINRIGAFILLPVYTNYLTLSQYGMLELLYSTQMVISSVLSMGFAHATLRFYFEYDSLLERKKVIFTSLISSFIISALGVLLLLPWNEKLSLLLFDSAEYADLFSIIYVMLVFEISVQINFAYFRAKEYSVKYVVISFVKFLIQVIFNALAVIVFKMGIKGVLLGNLLSVVISWLILIFITLKENFVQFDFKKLKDIFLYSYPLLFSSVGAIVLNNADRYLLKYFVSLEAVGVYALAVKFASILREIFSEPFNKNFSPFRFSVMKNDDAGKILSRLTVYFFLGFLTLGLGLSLYVQDVLFFMSKKEFWAAAGLVPVIVIALALNGLNYTFQTGILFVKKTKYMFYITTLSGVLTIVFNVILIPVFDAYGAALSQILVAVITVSLTYVVSQKLYFIAYEKITLFKIISAAIISFVLYMLIPIPGLYWGMVIKMVYMLVFFLLLWVSKCIGEEEKALIKSALVRFKLVFKKTA